MRRFVIGTAGHIDHGKTALVRALTGHDTDRLPEEKRRGISIDLGFAPLALAPDLVAGIVDVPGHERFVHNMLAGAAGVDVALLVVAADEGVMPQTREHLAILDLLGISTGVVAITKCDLVEQDWLALVQEEVRQNLGGTCLAGAPVLAVSAVTGQGLSELRQTLVELVQDLPPVAETGAVRLPVDRVFSVPGFGTVVTGTLQGNGVQAGDHLEILPGGSIVRVRGVQIHGQPVTKAPARCRVALNLVEREKLERGNVLVTPGLFRPQDTLVVKLRLLPGCSLREGARVRFHAGAVAVLARVHLLNGGRELVAGGEEVVALRCEQPVVVCWGDPFILRSYSPAITIGGGRLLDGGERYRWRKRANLKGLQALAQATESESLLALLGHVEPQPPAIAELAGRLGWGCQQVRERLQVFVARGEAFVLAGGHALAKTGLERMSRQVVPMLRRYHAKYPLRNGLPREELRQALFPDLPSRTFQDLVRLMVDQGVLVAAGEGVRWPGFRPQLTADQAKLACQLVEDLAVAGWQPPTPAELCAKYQCGGEQMRELLHYLVTQGELVRINEEIILPAQTVQAGMELIKEFLSKHGQLTVSQARAVLGTTRRFTLPFLTFLDTNGITQRTGEVRLPGKPKH